MKRKRPEYDEGIVRSVARKLYEVFYGGKAYSKIIKPRKKALTKRQKEIKATGLSRQSKKQLGYLHESDYQDVMKAFKRRK